MTTSINLKNILQEAVNSTQTVIPLQVQSLDVEIIQNYFKQQEIGVLIGITGNIKGRFFIDGNKETFNKVAEAFYGMSLNDEMLESFIGELGNMIAGGFSTNLSKSNIQIEITPPTVMTGQTKISAFKQALSVNLLIDDLGSIKLFLMVDEIIRGL